MGDEGYQPFPDISAWTAVPFDPTTHEQYAALLERARAEATEDAREHAVRTAIRYAGTDTGAIEGLYTTDRGFTRTVAIEAASWEAMANERGPHAAVLIKDQIEAYEWVLDLVTQARPVTEHVVRELHTKLCRNQDTYVVHIEVGTQERPLPKGEYKQFPNNPTSLATGQVHHYAPVDMVAPEMHRMVETLSRDEYVGAHPVVQAAFVHYAIAAIHPFADGNGRVARALASVPLYRALRVPLIVFRDQRDEYLDALERADAGGLGALVTFVNDRVIDAVDVVRTTVRLGRAADREQSLAALRSAYLGVGGLAHAELDAAAVRLLDVVRTLLEDQLTTIALPPGVSAQLTRAHGIDPGTIPSGYRVLADDVRIAEMIGLAASPPKAAAIAPQINAFVADSDGHAPFLLTSEFPQCGTIDLALRDVLPVVREVAKIRLAHWVDCVVDAALAELAGRVAAT